MRLPETATDERAKIVEFIRDVAQAYHYGNARVSIATRLLDMIANRIEGKEHHR